MVWGLHFILWPLQIVKQNGISLELLLMPTENLMLFSTFPINACVFMCSIFHLSKNFDVSKTPTCKAVYEISICTCSGRVLKIQGSEFIW